jgi:hypothetical protein
MQKSFWLGVTFWVLAWIFCGDDILDVVAALQA